LEALPEIGPARAQAIVEYRTTHGAFRSIDELANVPNISPRMVEEMRTLISVGP
jgi:competence protein ComEA